MPGEEAIYEMDEDNGTQFDPKVIEIILKEKIYDFLKEI
jgi:response regulator RpfG family c-di-GMP phosphodiesterase